MKLKLLCFFLVLFSGYIHAEENALLREYKLLYTDLANRKTWGYKSFFDTVLYKAAENINLAQGAIQMTGVPSHCAIMGEGFFKIRLENGLAGYTRSGEFTIDDKGTIVTHQGGYSLYDALCLGENFLPDTLNIARDGSVFVRTLDEKGNAVETRAGKLLIYRIPGEYLRHYDGAVYILKEGGEYGGELASNASIVREALEQSNYPLSPVILRMYYILSVLDKNIIPNSEFKKELLRIEIEAMPLSRSPRERKCGRGEYSGGEQLYLENILPFLKHDY